MKATLGEAIDVFLQHTRQLAGDGSQGRKLVEDQRRSRLGFVPETGTERVPIGIVHPVKLREEPGDLRGQARSLKGALSLVAHIVDGPLLRQDFTQEPRFAAATAAIQHSQRAFPALQQPRQAGGLLVAI